MWCSTVRLKQNKIQVFILWSCGLWHLVLWLVGVCFCTEDGNDMSSWNVHCHLLDYMMSNPTSLELLFINMSGYAKSNCKVQNITCSLCCLPHLFLRLSFNAFCQYTPLLNLDPLIFSLTPFGWLCCIMLTHYFLK